MLRRAALAAALISVALPGSAAGAERVTTRISLGVAGIISNGGDVRYLFGGEVRAHLAGFPSAGHAFPAPSACERDRQVDVVRDGGTATDVNIGSSQTSFGNYMLIRPFSPLWTFGAYYATVAPARIRVNGSPVRCSGARSRPVNVSPPGGG